MGSAGLRSMLEELTEIEGLQASFVVESSSGEIIAHHGDEPKGVVAAIRQHALVLQAQTKAAARQSPADAVEDIVISFEDHYHLLRPMTADASLFLLLLLARSRANLGLARVRLAEADRSHSRRESGRNR